MKVQLGTLSLGVTPHLGCGCTLAPCISGHGDEDSLVERLVCSTLSLSPSPLPVLCGGSHPVLKGNEDAPLLLWAHV